jgi:hypothetical protein
MERSSDDIVVESESERERLPLLVAEQHHELLSVLPPREHAVQLDPEHKDVALGASEQHQNIISPLRVSVVIDPLPIRIACAFLALLLSGFFSTAITYRGWTVLPALDLAGVNLALSPLLFFIFLLGLPPTARQFQVHT